MLDTQPFEVHVSTRKLRLGAKTGELETMLSMWFNFKYIVLTDCAKQFRLCGYAWQFVQNSIFIMFLLIFSQSAKALGVYRLIFLMQSG
uniref:Uncharacterized protein n=1 Tax=Rhizophora mucronata TaxID=61149 RepID=A0A2P2KF06_RHIMU